MAGQLEYDKTPGSNTTINGIGILGTDKVLNFDNALRQMMGDAASAITRVVDKSGNYTALKADFNQLIRATANMTLALTAAATLTSGWCIWVKADGGDVTVDPAGSEKINGDSSLTISDGAWAKITCTGTDFRSVGIVAAAAIETVVHAADPKTTPVDADETMLVDSEASNGLKKLTWANVKATLKAYFDTLYLGLAGGTLTGALILAADATDAKGAVTKQQMEGQKGLAKAWVCFNGTGTVAIKDSFNVSSVTDNGTGDYTINFATAMANTNYAVVGSILWESGGGRIFASDTKLTTSAKVATTNGNGAKLDSADINVIVFGA